MIVPHPENGLDQTRMKSLAGRGLSLRKISAAEWTELADPRGQRYELPQGDERANNV